VDLHNVNETILIQVTVTQENNKFKHTIENAITKYPSMKKLYFFILAMEFEHRDRNWFWNQDLNIFNFSENEYSVIDFKSIIKKIY
jgi:hypothetical protein